MEALLQVAAALFILFIIEIIPGYLFYSMGGWPCLALFATLECIRLMVNYFTAKK